MSTARAAIIVIGAEVLSGKVTDRNAPFLVRSLRHRGVEVLEIRVVPDDVGVIAEALRALCPKVDYVFTTGGVGPTHDDVTMQGVADALGVPLVRDPGIEARLRARHGERTNAAHLKMAELPRGAAVLYDAQGRVPVVRAGNAFVLPGVPAMVEACFAALAPTLVGSRLFAYALYVDASETTFAALLGEAQMRYPSVSMGSYPGVTPDEALPAHLVPLGERTSRAYRAKITFDARDESALRAAVSLVRASLQPGWLVAEEESAPT